MVVLLKHLWRTLRKAPWQPLLIMLTIMLSVTAGITAFRLSKVFYVRAETIKLENTSISDISVVATSDRAVGILFASDAEEVIGDRAKVFGELSLVGFATVGEKQNSLISVSAADLVAADRYFEFKYYEYGRFTDDTLDSCAIISKSFSDKSSLGVGDSIEVSLLGEIIPLSIQAVVENEGIMSERDMLISIGGITGILAERSGFIASLGDSFTPCNRILIRCNDLADEEDLTQALQKSDAFEDCVVENNDGKRNEDVFAVFETVAVSFLLFLVLVLACMLIMTSQSLMRRQRALEYSQFCAAGASRRTVALLQLGENLIYALIGGVIGILISPYALDYSIGLFEWERFAVAVGIEGIIFGLVLALVLSVASTLIAIARERKNEGELMLGESEHPSSVPESGIEIWIFLTLLCLSIIATVVVPTTHVFLPISAAIVFLVIFVYYAFVPVMRWLAVVLAGLLSKINIGIRSWYVALKLTANDHSLCHVGRLVCVLCALLISVLSCARTLTVQYDIFSEMIKCEIVSLNMSADLADEMIQCDGVEGVVKFGFDSNATLEEEHTVIAVYTSGDGGDCMSYDLMPEKLPHGYEVVLSEGLASLAGLEIGDKAMLNVCGADYDVTVIGIKRIAMCVVYADADYISDRNVMHGVKLESGLDTESAEYRAILSRLEAEGVMLTDAYEINGKVTETLFGFIKLVWVVVIAAFCIAASGCANVFSTGHRAGRRNRELVALCGADSKSVKRVNFIRLTFTIATAVAIGCIFGIVAIKLLNIGVRSFGFILL